MVGIIGAIITGYVVTGIVMVFIGMIIATKVSNWKKVPHEQDMENLANASKNNYPETMAEVIREDNEELYDLKTTQGKKVFVVGMVILICTWPMAVGWMMTYVVKTLRYKKES
jgi:hypothetical protein